MEMLWGCEFYRDALMHAEYGAMIHSGAFSGTPGATAKKQVTAWLEKNGAGKTAVNYRLRDWLISRQRYWERLSHHLLPGAWRGTCSGRPTASTVAG